MRIQIQLSCVVKIFWMALPIAMYVLLCSSSSIGITCIFFLFQLQDSIVRGELPCSKEDAATLASIQLHVEEAWPEDDLSTYTAPGLEFLDRKIIDPKLLSKPDAQENLRKRKILIRNRTGHKLSSSRRKGKLVRQLTCVGENEIEALTSKDLIRIIPAEYTTSKKIHSLIQVRYRHE